MYRVRGYLTYRQSSLWEFQMLSVQIAKGRSDTPLTLTHTQTLFPSKAARHQCSTPLHPRVWQCERTLEHINLIRTCTKGLHVPLL
jgi:hypothetical protein